MFARIVAERFGCGAFSGALIILTKQDLTNRIIAKADDITEDRLNGLLTALA